MSRGGWCGTEYQASTVRMRKDLLENGWIRIEQTPKQLKVGGLWTSPDGLEVMGLFPAWKVMDASV